MRLLLIGCVLLGLALLGWQVAILLSPDAVAMAVGMLFGVLACIPVALLLMASQRQRVNDDQDTEPTPDAAATTRQQTPAPMTTLTILSDEFSVTDMLSEIGGRIERLADGSIVHTEPNGRRVRMIDARGKEA